MERIRFVIIDWRRFSSHYVRKEREQAQRGQKRRQSTLSGKSNLDEDIVKLALLYFVEHVLLGKEGKNLIDLQWVQLVDSLEEFNKYPWGRICYERTLFGLQRALDKRQSKYVEKKKKKEECNL